MNPSPVISITSLDGLDWKDLDIKVGLEIHRQMKGIKLFCRCPSGLEEDVIGTVMRGLVPRDSEIGLVDDAAVAHHSKGAMVTYEITSNTCPIELDEEPPIPPTEMILENALLISMLMGCDPIDRIQFMRKIVIDGSNPSGFQRTGLIGIGGSVSLSDGHEIGIATVCLEEDAARRIPDPSGMDLFRLDRAGTPEIEISTEPCISDPRTAVEVAKRIGDLLRSTGSVKRGIGSIRQDVNVSVKGGPRVEVKLVQDLPTIGKVVKFEAIRHLLLTEVSSLLRDRGIGPDAIDPPMIDLTRLFKSTLCKVISSGLSKGDIVLGIKLRGFARTMGDRAQYFESYGPYDGWSPLVGLDDLRRLGPEFAGYVKASTNLKGLFHSDELPGYGVTTDEVSAVNTALEVDPSIDGFVIICAEEKIAKRALGTVIGRARLAFDGIVPEVRRALPDGRTEYLRPLSGSARMYPETDVPCIVVTDDLIKRALSKMPEDPLKRMDRLSTQTGLSKDNIIQMDNLELLDRFEMITSKGADPRTISNLLLKGAEALGDIIDTIPDPMIAWIGARMTEGRFTKESTKDILSTASDLFRNGSDLSIVQAQLYDRYSSSMSAMTELSMAIETLTIEKRTFVLEKGIASVGPLMGPIMKRFRGKVDGSIVESELKKRVQALLEGK